MHRRSGIYGGFSIIELLVVLGIILLLITILLPVLSRVRQAAFAADTQNLIGTIASAVERYHQDYQYYPGPLSDATILQGTATPTGVNGWGRVTMSENLVLGLCGGLAQANAYYPDNVGRGPAGGNAYLEVTEGSGLISSARAQFRDEIGISPNDTFVPEFIDRYPLPLPILYLRARVGAAGVCSNGAPYSQYDLGQLLPYTGVNLLGKTHGLRALGGNGVMLDPKGVNDAIRYLRDPSDNTAGTARYPRGKDAYLLISAGRDRIYGTLDDILNTGALLP